MSTAADLRAIFEAGRPLVERWLDLSEEFAALRDAATNKGLDWSQVKSLLKAQVQDERDGADGKRVNRIVERADFASSYADMLGLGGTTKMNENNFSADEGLPTAEDVRGILATPAEAPVVRSARIIPPPSEEALEIPGFLDRRGEARAQ